MEETREKCDADTTLLTHRCDPPSGTLDLVGSYVLASVVSMSRLVPYRDTEGETYTHIDARGNIVHGAPIGK